MPVDCCHRLTLPVTLRIVTLCALTGFLLSEFVSHRGIATKSQSIIMGLRLVDIAKISMIYLLYLAVKLKLTEIDLKSWFQLGCHRRLQCHCQRLMALDGVLY